MANCKGCGRNESLSNLSKHPGTCYGEGPNRRKLQVSTFCASGIASRVSSEYKSKELLLSQFSRHRQWIMQRPHLYITKTDQSTNFRSVETLLSYIHQ
jgi:hypothetical protein